MNQRSFILGTLLIVIVFLFAVGAMAIFSSGDQKDQPSYEGSNKNSMTQSNAQDYAPTQYGNQIVVNKYSNQPALSQESLVYCHQQTTGYYNNQPIVQCIPDGAPSIIQESPSQVTKINIYNSVSGGYYPYPKYSYQKYPGYHKYPSHHHYHPPYFQYW